MERLAETVSDVLRTSVTDATGANGKFDITVQVGPLKTDAYFIFLTRVL
ncbi:hypothetical protein SBA3_1340023 [Candidatus Sulfopaludibacter sp. SbA3]|nr:hypothetical protein SBA3_1340023 [Candidatus Sulfopaludibacter sp. SbA3]